ncbi:TolC family protein [Aeromonas sp. R9-1]|uniref:TolC family protein n=1 Tax=Aeromonas sp. R9-1 TaxID=3138478 RepID=UPI0034A2FE70
MMTRPLLLMVGSLLLLGCSQRSDYHRPDLDLPTHWQGQQASPPLHDTWWRAFGDPALDSLVERVLAANPDLAIAGLRLRQAALALDLAQGESRPSVTGTLGTSASRPLDRHAASVRSANSNLGLGYEVDLWGRLSAVEESARWEAEATWEDREATRLTLIGKTLEAYWQLGYLHQAIASGEADLAAARQTRQLTESRYRAGAVGRLELAQAEQSLAGRTASQLDLTRQQETARNTLRLLLGTPHGPLPVIPSTLPDALPTPAPGLPAELLSRRPDVKAAELRLRKQLAEGDQLRASLYPTLSLTAAVNGSSQALAELLQNPVGSLGANLALPFLEWEKGRQRVAQSELAYQQAEIAFRKQLYEALVEVDNALTDTRIGRERETLLADQLRLARESERLARARYRAGATGVQSWLDEQGRLRSAELAWLDQRRTLLLSLARLCQSLGGGMGSDARPDLRT